MYDSVCLEPLSSTVCSAASKALYSILVAFCVSENERVQTTGCADCATNLSLICALTCAGTHGAAGGQQRRR